MTAEEIRALMTTEPKLLELSDEIRTRFGGRLTWLKAGQVEIGKQIRDAVVETAFATKQETTV